MKYTLFSMIALFSAVILIGQPLPEEFKQLPGTWNFDKVLDGDSDLTDMFVEGQLGGVKYSMTLNNDDGTIAYSDQYLTDRNIGTAYWRYYPKNERVEHGQGDAIDFVLIHYYNDGNESMEYYSLVSVGENELVYENKVMGMKFVFTR